METEFRNGKALTRRRFLEVTALGGLGATAFPLKGLAETRLQRWRGTAMGAEASITLGHNDPEWVAQCLTSVRKEIDRLEDIFSLYRDGSALVRLNRDGVLQSPPVEMIELMEKAASFSQLTQGAFDVTVQPLWALYTGHFRHEDADPAGPEKSRLEKARRLVGFQNISIEGRQISFSRPGMAVTLNGIAQGFITDRICELLREKGFRNVLVNMGETRALGTHPLGRPWRMGIEDPGDPARIARRIDLADGAMATSGGYGTRLDSDGRFHHIFDPQSGETPGHFTSVTVTAPDATTADALSTALAILPEDRARKCLERTNGCRAYVIRRNGRAGFLSPRTKDSGTGI